MTFYWRMCAGLDKFKEIELDFSDVEFIGQGFAHQVFVLFAKAHPEIFIHPINMNDTVKSVYDHVMNTK